MIEDIADPLLQTQPLYGLPIYRRAKHPQRPILQQIHPASLLAAVPENPPGHDGMNHPIWVMAMLLP
jgi:hypothetical protein